MKIHMKVDNNEPAIQLLVLFWKTPFPASFAAEQVVSPSNIQFYQPPVICPQVFSSGHLATPYI